MGRIYIKNMVCNRCIMVVRQELEKMGLLPLQVSLGEVELAEQPDEQQLPVLTGRLQELGFELLDDKKQKQIEAVKNLIIQKVQQGTIEEHFSLSQFLSASLNKDYAYITRLFSVPCGPYLLQDYRKDLYLNAGAKRCRWIFAYRPSS